MSGEFKPRARTAGLVVNEMADEIVIYDLESHKAHCLNRTAALVWKGCDGRTTPAKLKAAMERELNSSVSEELVWYALEQLNRDQLLAEPINHNITPRGLSRREVVKRLGLTAVIAIPLITTIVAPTAVEAAASGCVDCSGVLCCPPATCVGGACIKS